MFKRIFRKISCTNECHWRQVRIDNLKGQLKRKIEAVELLEERLEKTERAALHYYHEAENVKRSLESASRGQAFSQDEIKTLIRLCHPDKHGNRQSAVRITQKLLSMRG